MLRYLALGVGVFLVRLLLAVVIGWLANRRGASWLHVAAVTNTVIVASLAAMVAQFAQDGLTLFSVCVAGLMIWLAYSAVTGGNIAALAIKANRQT